MLAEGREIPDRSEKKYDAFLSYSHADIDFATWLSRRLRSYRPPKQTKITTRLAVFRDVEILTAGSALDNLLYENIADATYLVVIATPDCARSEHVNRELKYFLQIATPQRIRIVLLRGELEECLPPVLQSNIEEPLFIDMRPPGRRHRRFESLRLIASLYDVNYSYLRLEDETRRRRRRMAMVTSTLFTCLAIGSGYLATITPSETWKRIVQPVTETWSNALVPVTKVAIKGDNPSTVVWFGRNALHAKWLASARTSWRLQSSDALAIIPEIIERSHTNQHYFGKSIADLKLQTEKGYAEQFAGVNMRLTVIDGSEGALYVVSGYLKMANDRQRTVPLAIVDPSDWIDTLEPEPAGMLLSSNLGGYSITGSLIDNTKNGESTDVHYLGDSSDDAMEVLDATVSRQYLVFSNDKQLDDSLWERQEVNDAQEIWNQEMMISENWVTYAPPRQTKRSFLAADLEAATVIDNGPNSDVFAQLISSLMELDDDFPAGDYYDIRTVMRNTITIATVQATWDSHDVVQQPPPIFMFKDGQQSWSIIHLPLSQPRSTVVDILQADKDPSLLICATDGDGLYRSLDSGVTWEDFNLSESAFKQSSSMQLISPRDGDVYALAILHTEPGEDVNPLFRLQKRNWIDRVRIGLANVLNAEK